MLIRFKVINTLREIPDLRSVTHFMYANVRHLCTLKVTSGDLVNSAILRTLHVFQQISGVLTSLF